MSQSATPATRNEATSHLKPPEMTPSAIFPIGTELRRHYDNKRRETTTNDETTHAREANSGPTPRPPTINGNPVLRIREKDCEQI